jgi:hypothetical protein
MAISDVPALPQDVPTILQNDGASADTLYSAPTAGARILTVGVGEEYATLAAAIAASRDGDVIEVQAGTYVNDTADITHSITIEGVGGMVNLVETEPLPNEKGILIVDGAKVTIANITFSGAEIPDSEGANGAGIRYQGGDLILINDVFTGNQNGIMGTPVDGLLSNTVTIENSSFANNGDGMPESVGYGTTHDLYIGTVSNLLVENSVFLGVNGVGNVFKSRAEATCIVNNVISDMDTAASYSIDLPNGGVAQITGNFIEQGVNSPNWAIMEYSAESLPYANSSLVIQGNTIVNQSAASGSVGLVNYSGIMANVTGNTIVGLTSSQLVNGPVQATGNVDGSGTALSDITNAVQLLGGNNIVFTDTADHTVTITSSNQGVEGGAGALTVVAEAGHIAVIGGSGGLTYTEQTGFGGSLITTAVGSVNTITISGQDTVYSQGVDTIIEGTGNASVTVTGIAQVLDGSGNNLYTVRGTADVTGGGGSDFVTVSRGGNAFVHGSEYAVQMTSVGGNFAIDATISGSLEQATVEGGSVTVQSYSSALNFKTAGGSEGATIVLGAGASNVLSYAADTIYAGSGTDLLQLNGGGQTVYAGSGTLSIYGRGVSATNKANVYGNGGDYFIGGDSGNIIYHGGASDSTVEASLSNISIVGGAGHVTINGGSVDTISGGSGGITLNGGGSDYVTTAAGSTNVITLVGSSVVISYGNDAIDLGTSNQSVTVYGNATVTGTGSNRVTLLGTDSLTSAGGNESIAVVAGANVTITSAAFTNLTESGATVAYTANAGGDNSTATVIGGAASIFSAAGSALTVVTVAGLATTVELGQGTAVVDALGQDTIRTGAANAFVSVQANGIAIYGGSGSLTVNDQDYSHPGDNVTIYGGSGSASLIGVSGEKMTFIGGSGNANITGGSGILCVTGGSGDITVTGGSGGVMNFIGGSGNANISASPSGANIQFGSGTNTVSEAGYGNADIYSFLAGVGGGTDIITGFRAGIDQLRLSGVSVATEQVSGGSTYLTLSDHTSIQLMGYALGYTVASGPNTPTIAPMVTIALATATTVAMLAGTADPNATVTLTTGSTTLGTATANGSGIWSFNPPMAAGSYTVVASETDVAGNTASALATFTLNTAAVFNPGTVNYLTVYDPALGAHAVILGSGGGNTAILGGGNDTISGTGSGDTVIGGAGNISVLSLLGNSTISIGNGTDTVALNTSGAHNSVTVGNGNDHITAGNGGNETVTAGSGNNVITAGGANDVITAGGGANTVTASGAFATITAGNGNNIITAGGANDQITTGSGNDTITVTAAGLATITAGLGLNTIAFAGSGNVVINRGGTDTLTDTGTNNTIVLPLAGQGLDTMNGNVLSNGDTLDLRAAMAATGWDQQMADLGMYLSFGTSGANATVMIDPTGLVGGTTFTVAILNNASSLSLNSFLTVSAPPPN